MLKGLKRAIQGTVIIGVGTVSMGIVLTHPFTPKRFCLLCGQLLRNVRLIPNMFRHIIEFRKVDQLPWWLVILGLPFVAMLVMLEDYD